MLILASSSAPRKELLSRLRLPFQTVIPDADETPYPQETSLALVRRLSELKARIVAKDHPNSLIIAGDQVGECEGEILCKPGNHENAVRQLKKLSNNTVIFYAGLCVLNSRENRIQIEVITSHIVFRFLTDNMIEDYLRDKKPYNCAGSLMVEQLGITLVKGCRSSDPTAIMGLPLICLTSMLMNEGVNILGSACTEEVTNS